MTDTIRCGWLPANNQHQLTRPGMSEGDRAAWRARFGCQNPAQWMLRSEGLSRCGEIHWPVACCTSHLGLLVKVASGCEVKDHVVWAVGDEEPRRVKDLVDAAVAIESATMQAQLDLVRTGAARARREYDELDVVIRDAMHELGASVPQTHEGRVRAIQTMGRISEKDGDSCVLNLGVWSVEIIADRNCPAGAVHTARRCACGSLTLASCEQCAICAHNAGHVEQQAGPEVHITNVRIDRADPDRWIADMAVVVGSKRKIET